MIALESINPHIRFAKALSFYYKHENNSVSLDCRLFYIQNGSGSVKINNISHDFFCGSVFYLPPKTKYNIEFEDYNDLTMLVFNFDLTSQYSSLTSSLGTFSEEDYREEQVLSYEFPKEFENPIFINNAPQLLKPLTQCIGEYFNKEPFFNIIISAKFKLALIELLKETPQFGCSSLILRIYKYIHNNCELSTVTPTEISEYFNYHPYYLSQIMKKNTGYTIQQYLTYYRIKTAKNYLTTSDLDVSHISGQVGFNSVAYFIKVFKEHTGETPTQYRKNHNFF